MSTLWTPDGEHPVDRPRPSPPGTGAPPPPPDDDPDHDDDPLAQLSPEDRERALAMAEEMEAVRRQLASVPAAVVVANHVMGLFELAAIHLSSDPPNLAEATVAIDAMGAVVDRLSGRLGEAESTLRDSLGQIRLAFVQVRSTRGEDHDAAAGGDDDDDGDDRDDDGDKDDRDESRGETAP